MKKLLILLAIGLGIYQYANKPGFQSAQQLVPGCDAVVFTTQSCPYCKLARDFLDSKQVNWCEYDINESKANKAFWKESGGKGVPHSIIGDITLKGWNESKFQQAASLLYK
jgi:glutaredoxin